jgi:NAD(P)-dependent dehydrogenase (short-subunit alcohol dehydrogenase family)
MPMNVLDGKVAIIAGGTSGIGLRVAALFSKEGAKVLIAGRREREGQALAMRLGKNVDFLRVDVAQESDVSRMISVAMEMHGRLDCILNNAGGPGSVKSIEDISLDEFDRDLTNNLKGTFLGMKHAAPVMRRQKSGSIINTASIAGGRSAIASHSYSAAKAAVIHLSRCVAVELGDFGVRVNSISPGVTLTDTAISNIAATQQITTGQAETLMTDYLKQLQPIPRAGTSDDIAHVALFLASDASTFITGQDFVVDGGYIGRRKWKDV